MLETMFPSKFRNISNYLFCQEIVSVKLSQFVSPLLKLEYMFCSLGWAYSMISKKEKVILGKFC